jgi:hypothetical protein
MNKRILSLMTAALMVVLMMAFASCKKDSGGGSGDDPDNPYLGIWVSEDDEDVILEVKTAKWTVKEGDVTLLEGTYIRTGNTATLKVTDAIEGLDLEAGDEGTATISGKKLLVEFYGEVEVFVKQGGDPPPPPGDIYREPCLKWGATKSVIKQYETRELVDEDDDYLEYDGENKDVAAVVYPLDDKDNLLHRAIVLFNNTSNIEERVMDFLKEKYDYKGKDDEGDDYLESSDGKTRVYLYYHSQAKSLIADYYDANYYAFDKSPLPAKSFRKTIQTGLLR